MISTVYVLQEDNSVATYIMPLQGDENSFSYKADSCEYILEAKVGKRKKKTARQREEYKTEPETVVDLQGSLQKMEKDSQEETVTRDELGKEEEIDMRHFINCFFIWRSIKDRIMNGGVPIVLIYKYTFFN